MNFEPINNPTWEYPIKSFFNAIDVNHMLKVTQGKLNLSKYSDVKDNAPIIYAYVSSKRMPIPPSQVWSDEMIELYKLWLDNGCPEGSTN